MGQKVYEIDEKDLLNIDSNSSELIDQEIVEKSSFQYLKVIGKGGFGKVWQVLHKKSQIIYAMKEMSKVKILERKNETSIKNERMLLSKMFHPFIVNMHYAFQDSDNLYLIVDYLSGGDLRYQYCFDKDFNEEQTKFIICCILLSLEYIHTNNILHRDIKPENLIFDKNGYLKLTDFGIAKIYNKNIDNSKDHSGTLGYIAPEVLFHLRHDYRCDYYALGIVGYELMAKERPYEFNNRNEAREIILEKEAKITKKTLKSGWSKYFMDFINKLIKRKPEERLGKNGIEEIKNHPWLKYFNWKDLYLMKIKAPFIPSENDNFDSKYCNEDEIISEELQIKYKNIMNSIRYKFIFEDYKYYNRKNDDIIKNIINKENNISKNISSILKNVKGKKPIILRNQNGALYKTTWKKYTMDNLNNMISQYKSMDLDNNNKNKEQNEDNDNDIYDYEDGKNEENDFLFDDMKPFINPHLVYRALEQKEIECLSNDEEEENKKIKKNKKLIHKSQSPINLKIKKITKNINIEGRNKNGIKTFKSNPINMAMDKIKMNKIKENNYIDNKIKKNKLNNKNENLIKQINENKNNKKINGDKKDNNCLKVNLISNKNYKNDIIIHNSDKINNNNYIINNNINNIIKVNKNNNLKPKNFQQ